MHFIGSTPKEGLLMRLNKTARSVATLPGLANFAKKNEDETITVALPDDLGTLSDEELETLRQSAIDAFNELYQGGEVELTADQVTVLGQLKEAKVALDAERVERAGKAEQVKADAAALAAEMEDAPAEDEAEVVDEADAESTEDEAEVVAEAEAATEEAAAPQPIAASATPAPRAPISVPRLRSRQTPVSADPAAPRSPFRAAVNVPGLVPDADLDMDQVATAFGDLQARAPRNAVAAALRGGQRFSQKQEFAHIIKPFDPRAVADGDAGNAIAFATDQSRLPQGSLVAAGGWCAPSETLYDLCKLESTDGILSVPEVQVSRGGIRFTQGPDWADIFANTGFTFTEADDIDGNYDGAASGPSPKPCDVVPCPDFTEVRLDVSGVCISGGNLLNRAYPELVTRYVSGALTAHAHRVATQVLADMITGSTAVTPAGSGVGDNSAASPVLSAIELQAEDMKYRYRMPRGATMEAIFPFWARGVIRADLSRRQGVDMLNVTDAQIDGWFRARGINPQFIYNFDNLGTLVGGALRWPATLRFLIYPAGTWVRGSSDIITLSMLHDSTLNAENNFTAVFTEEGWSVMKMCHMSRVVTVAVCASGTTNAGLAITCA